MAAETTAEGDFAKAKPKALDELDPDEKPAKTPQSGSTFVIMEQSEQWVGKDDDFVFDGTKIILRQGNSFFMASTDKREWEFNESAADDLERIRIPPEDFCPPFKDGLTLAPMPLPQGMFVKRPTLLLWDPDDRGSIAALVLQEAEVCEILRRHPHPNVARCHGCLVDEGRITGLCFSKYEFGLGETLAKNKDISEGQRLAYFKAIQDGLRHLHRLGLAHNDINPSNIMMDGDKPVIIDFDSTRPIGEKLGSKAGTFEWEREGAELSDPENDFFGLDKIREVTLQLASP